MPPPARDSAGNRCGLLCVPHNPEPSRRADAPRHEQVVCREWGHRPEHQLDRRWRQDGGGHAAQGPRDEEVVRPRQVAACAAARMRCACGCGDVAVACRGSDERARLWPLAMLDWSVPIFGAGDQEKVSSGSWSCQVCSRSCRWPTSSCRRSVLNAFCLQLLSLDRCRARALDVPAGFRSVFARLCHALARRVQSNRINLMSHVRHHLSLIHN